jgi:hypothetical protein
MGLKSVAENAAKAIFLAVGDIVVDCSISRKVGEVYDEVTDTFSGGTLTTYSFGGVVKQYAHGMVDGETIQTGDYMVIIRQEDISTTPVNGETVTVNGELLKIISFVGDAADATYTLQVRQ